MRVANVFMHGRKAGTLIEETPGRKYRLEYDGDYDGEPISLNMPISKRTFEYDRFPPFFDGLLPEGAQLEALLKRGKLDRDDYFSQLLTVGADLVGAVTVGEST